MLKLVVLCYVVAAAAANVPIYFTPAVIPPLGYPVPLPQALYNYRGPLSLAPGQPANILAADGRPLDTLAVNLDRSAHFVAKALDNGPRVLKKRSVTRLAVAPGSVGFSAAVAAGNIGLLAPVAVGPAGVAVNIATNPIGLTGPLAARAFSPFAAGPIGLSGPFANGPIGLSGPLAVGPIGLTGPLAAGSLAAPAVPAPVAAGSIAASSAGVPIGVSASGTPLVRAF